jgi:hypothetical protein
VHDTFRVRGFERFGDLEAEAQRFLDRQRARLQLLLERLTLDELHRNEQRARLLIETVDRADMRVIERGEQLRFAFEAREAFLVRGERRRQRLDRDLATSRPSLVSRAR